MQHRSTQATLSQRPRANRRPLRAGAFLTASVWLAAWVCFAAGALHGGVEVEPGTAAPEPAAPSDAASEAELAGSSSDRDPHLPAAVGADDFRELTARSPFSRSLNLSDALILTGVAIVDGEEVATLLNKETKETFVVSSRLNPQGWRMVELNHGEDLEKVAAKVAVAGGEVVTVRYAEWALKPGEARPGAGPGEGGTISIRGTWGDRRRGESRRGEGEGRMRGGPPPEMRERLSQLSEDQRATLFRRMSELRERNPEMSWEERGRVMMQMADRLANQ